MHVVRCSAIEADIRDKKLTRRERRRDYRLIHAKPRVELSLPGAAYHADSKTRASCRADPLTEALAYIQMSEAG